jgi:hypothetical protein
VAATDPASYDQIVVTESVQSLISDSAMRRTVWSNRLRMSSMFTKATLGLALLSSPPLRAPWRPRRATASLRTATRTRRTTVTPPIWARIRTKSLRTEPRPDTPRRPVATRSSFRRRNCNRLARVPCGTGFLLVARVPLRRRPSPVRSQRTGRRASNHRIASRYPHRPQSIRPGSAAASPRSRRSTPDPHATARPL